MCLHRSHLATTSESCLLFGAHGMRRSTLFRHNRAMLLRSTLFRDPAFLASKLCVCALARVCVRQVFVGTGMYTPLQLKAASRRSCSQQWCQVMVIAFDVLCICHVPSWPGFAKRFCAAISGDFDDVTRSPFSWFQCQHGLPSSDGCGRFFRRRQLRRPCKYVATK